LDRWQAEGKALRLWLRDDDAVEPTEQLEQLIGLSTRFSVPILLAVIPMLAQPSLARRLDAALLLRPCQHGFRHQNHAPPGGKAEFGPHRASEAMIAELAAGRRRLQELFGTRALPVFVPPWNRIDPPLVAQLPGLGFSGLSSFRTMSIPKTAGLTTVNADFDIIDWKAGRIGRTHVGLVEELLTRLRARRHDGHHDQPFGVLTHHLVHDATAWSFLADFLTVMCAHPTASVVDPADLFAARMPAEAIAG
jgi:hypothetical protein